MRQKLKQMLHRSSALLSSLCKYMVYAVSAMLAIGVIAFLIIQFYFFPNINQYKSRVEAIASEELGVPVSIDQMKAGWRGVYPQVTLSQVTIQGKQHDSLRLPELSAAVAWKSLALGQIRFAHLRLIQPELTIQRLSNGQFIVGGIPVHQDGHDSGGLDWLLAQHHIEIEQGILHWQDDVRHAPELTLNQVDFSLYNAFGRHHLQLNASPVLPSSSPVAVDMHFGRTWRAVLSHQKDDQDLAQWYANIHLNVPKIDFAVWKSYIDYPVNVAQGSGAIEANLTVDHAKVTSFTAQLNVNNVKMQWNDQLAPLDLKVFRGEVTGSETYAGYFNQSFWGIGKLGHTISLKNVYLELGQGNTLSSDYMTERYWPATASSQEKTEFQFASLDLKTLALLAKSLPLRNSQQQMLHDLQPSGALSHFTVSWEGDYPDISHYQLKGDFQHLGLAAQPFRAAVPKTNNTPAIAARMAMPGIQNMSGTIDATDAGGQLTLAAQDAVIALPGYISAGQLNFNQFNFNSNWTIKPDNQVDINLHQLDFTLDHITGSISGTQKINIEHPAASWVDMHAKVSNINVNDMPHYLPTDMDTDVRNWLLGALIKGDVPEVNVHLQGKLNDFPYSDHSGIFHVDGLMHEVTMNYYPGHLLPDYDLPDWPLLSSIEGDFAIDGSKLTINAKDAVSNNLQVPSVKAVIDDLSSAKTTLHIDGLAQGTMQNMFAYVEHSPVDHWLDGFTQGAVSSGNGKLHLQFQMPLNDPDATTVQGTLSFLNNDVQLFSYLPPVNGTTGKLHFNEKGFSLEQIQGHMLGQPLTVDGGTAEDGSTSVNIHGSIESAGLRHEWGNSVFTPLINQLDGKTDFLATVQHHNGNTEIKVSSSLQGLSSHLPVPFAKRSEEVLPVSFVLKDIPSQDPLLLKDLMTLKLGNVLDLAYHRQKIVDGDWQVTSGGMGIFHAAPQPDHGVTLYIDMPVINMDAWSHYRSALENHLTQADQSQSMEASYSQYAPTTVIAQTPELHLSQRTFHHVFLAASRDNGIWRSNMRSDEVEGYVSWAEPKDDQDLGHVVARLKRLIIPESEAENIEKASEQNRYTNADIPSLDIEADNFELFHHQLGKLTLKASTKDTADGQEWQIHQLQLSNDDGHLLAQGKWQLSGNQSHTHLTYALDVADAGKLLTRLHFDKMMAGGKGRLDGDVTWNGSPFALDIPSMKGSMTLALNKGQFLKIEPGAARLLGVLSLQSLPRRLTLDFKDIFSSGLAFDHVNGNAKIQNGVMSTDSLHIHSVSVDIHLKGNVDLDKETQQLAVTVVPDVSLGAASVAVMAVNPIVGLGTFFTQWALQGSLNKSLTYMYDISGSWADPVVVKRDNDSTKDKNK